MKKNIVLILLAFILGRSFASASDFKIDHRIPLAGGEGWDYLAVDVSSGKLFITRFNHVDVLDLKTEKIVGTISEGIDGVHGVAFASRLKKGYLTCGNSDRVLSFDLETLKVLKSIPAGRKTDSIVFDDLSSRIFAFNEKDESITVIDANNDEVLKTIKLVGTPEFAVGDHRGHIYFNNEDKSEIFFLDAQKMEVTKSWSLKGCQAPSGLSADFSSRRLFSVCRNEVMAISSIDKGVLIKTLPIGKGPDASVFDSKLIFSSNGSGSLTIVQEKGADQFDVLQNLPTQVGARTMAVDPSTHLLYLIAAKYEKANAKNKEARPKIIPGTVELLVIKK